MRSFGEQLKQFALTLNIADNGTVKSAHEVIQKYIEKTLKIPTALLLVESVIDSQPGLSWTTDGGAFEARRIRYDNGSFTGLPSIAYALKKPLWIVSRSKSPLSTSADLADLWSDIPIETPYEQLTQLTGQGEVYTCILVPLWQDKQVWGVLNFETHVFVEATMSAKQELQTIADAIGILHKISKSTEGLRKNTDLAISLLRETLDGPLPELTKPRIFLASSSQADEGVVQAIQQLITKEFSTQATLVYWKEIHEPGNINQQLLKEISTCRYAVCYFSEPVENGITKYVDNPNVVFEAGMLHALTNDLAASPVHWLPIREKESTALPFDFAANRTLFVPRNEDGSLQGDKFNEDLRDKVIAMMDT